MFDEHANTYNNGFLAPELHLSKKKAAQYSLPKDKQNKLWEEEVKKASNSPGPQSYKPNSSLTQYNCKGTKNIFGFGVKSNQTLIKYHPGPQDYENNNYSHKFLKMNSYNFKLTTQGSVRSNSVRTLAEVELSRKLARNLTYNKNAP